MKHETKDPAAVALGRRGGKATKGIVTRKKKAAVRRNLEKARKQRWPKKDAQ
jgi:hypothetical protein